MKIKNQSLLLYLIFSNFTISASNLCESSGDKVGAGFPDWLENLKQDNS